MRGDLRQLQVEEDSIAELHMLTAHRADIAADRTRSINRLRGHLLGVFAALERALDLTNKGPLILITGFQTAQAISDTGREELERWLRDHRVRCAANSPRSPAKPQSNGVRIRGEATAAAIIDRPVGDLGTRA